MSSQRFSPVLSLLLPIAVVASGCAASSTPSGSPPAPSVVATASPAGIDHPAGATEIVLRFDEGGGFVPIEFTASHVPQFTLYGDGTVVFVRADAAMAPGPDGIQTGSPIRTARLSEGQVQALLEFALRDGGLAIARAEYQNQMVADAPTATFEIHAGGDAKTVSVVALGLDAQPGPDSAIKAAFVRLADRLRDFDQGGSLASAPYQPVAYRGVLVDTGGGVVPSVRPWPWQHIAPGGFASGDPSGGVMRTRTLTPDEAAAIGVTGIENGISSGLWLAAPDGTTYSFVLRPLLPDEDA